jgi:8-amino-7-oxononanoate synthase
MLDKILSDELNIIKEKGLLRQTKAFSPGGCTAISDGVKELVNFSSNNYLCLSWDPRVIAAGTMAMKIYGAGGTSSRLVAGTFDIHVELEELLAKFKGTEAALVYPTGYQANIGAIGALLSNGGCIILDKLAHASLWDAAKLSKSKTFVFEHNDMESLETVLKKASTYKVKIIATESVFSMDGDMAPLTEISSLAMRYGAISYVDEAHATGIYGKNGSGLVEQLGLNGKLDIIMGTLSKALGSQGGYVCGSKELIDYLKNRSRSFIYTTSLAPSSCAAATEAIKITRSEPAARTRLIEISKVLRSRIQALGFEIGGSRSQIIPIITGNLERTKELSTKLYDNCILAPCIRPPTVPEGKSRIRISLSSGHSDSDLSKLLKSLSTSAFFFGNIAP